MAIQERDHPLIYSYLKKYQEDPTSRIFAPLAEAYRKAGLIREAIEIAREGLRIHPRFVGGRVALARALFDQREYPEVVRELAEVVRDVPDNLVAQRLLAESFLMMGRAAEALSAYKMLLYFSPEDSEINRLVQELESQAYDRGTLILRTDSASGENEFRIRQSAGAIDADPDERRKRWVGQIEFLQGMLQRVERYKIRNSLAKTRPSPSTN